MHKQYFISDPHHGHNNILKFKDDAGKLTRVFESIEEHDNLIIENINKIVRPCDKLYILGDVVINRKNMSILDRIVTKKRILIRGNHDIFQLKDYTPYFKDIRAYKIMPKYGIIFSHIPIHPYLFEGRWKLNVHGHMHHNYIYDGDSMTINEHPSYFNICPERIGYEPIELQSILDVKSERGL